MAWFSLYARGGSTVQTSGLARTVILEDEGDVSSYSVAVGDDADNDHVFTITSQFKVPVETKHLYCRRPPSH